MDPNVNLREQLSLARTIIESNATECPISFHSAAVKLAKLVLDMNRWFEKDGSFPSRWLDGWAAPMRRAMAEARGISVVDLPAGFEASVYSVCSRVNEEKKARAVVERIVEKMYPGGDTTCQWNDDLIHDIHSILVDEDFVPPCSHEIDHKQGITAIDNDSYEVGCLKCESIGKFKFEGHTAEITWSRER